MSRTVIVCEYDDRRGPGTDHAFGRTSLSVSCLFAVEAPIHRHDAEAEWMPG